MLKHLKLFIEFSFLWRSGQFNVGFYNRTYPDVNKAGINPLLHFINYGWKEGRNPSELFDTKYYLTKNPDVSKASINPLLHYLCYGRNEGREPYIDSINVLHQKSRNDPLKVFFLPS